MSDFSTGQKMRAGRGRAQPWTPLPAGPHPTVRDGLRDFATVPITIVSWLRSGTSSAVGSSRPSWRTATSRLRERRVSSGPAGSYRTYSSTLDGVVPVRTGARMGGGAQRDEGDRRVAGRRDRAVAARRSRRTSRRRRCRAPRPRCAGPLDEAQGAQPVAAFGGEAEAHRDATRRM
ncbi:hypothetical protein ACWGI8_12795 [Streptomyces sp. NPDC054841]